MARLPLDKSWIKCCTLMEVYKGGQNVEGFLSNYPEDEMSDDVRACRDVLYARHDVDYRHMVFPVRNFRSLAVGLLEVGRHKGFGRDNLLMGKQLSERKLIDPRSSQLTTVQLLLAGETNTTKMIEEKGGYDKLPYHTRIAISAKYMFKSDNIYKEDKTLRKQFNYFIQKLQGKDVTLHIESAEDVPLAYLFGEITMDEIEKKLNDLVNSTDSGYKWTKNTMALLEKLTEYKKDNPERLSVSIKGAKVKPFCNTNEKDFIKETIRLSHASEEDLKNAKEMPIIMWCRSCERFELQSMRLPFDNNFIQHYSCNNYWFFPNNKSEIKGQGCCCADRYDKVERG